MSDGQGRADGASNVPDEMAVYLQTFLDETEEQLDDLVETILALESDATNQEELNEAFRLIHSIKGSAGMMGFDNITVLTHHLESRFERFRSGTEQLDDVTMSVVLRCIDFLKQCNMRLRGGQKLGSPAELLDELKHLEENADSAAASAADALTASSVTGEKPQDRRLAESELESMVQPDSLVDDDQLIYLVVRFRAGLQLADLKAQLIMSRLSGLGDVKGVQPDLPQLAVAESVEQIEIRLSSRADIEHLRATADVEGVESIDVRGGMATRVSVQAAPEAVVPAPTAVDEKGLAESVSAPLLLDATPAASGDPAASGPKTADVVAERAVMEPAITLGSAPAVSDEEVLDDSLPHEHVDESSAEPSTKSKPSHGKVMETMRVDIDRLDSLMNLTGELVVNRARFEEVMNGFSPALRKASMLNRIRDFRDSLQSTIENLKNAVDSAAHGPRIQGLLSGLELLNEQSEILENGRRCFTKLSEAVDQLSVVSHNLQRGVFDTRMVPIAPLFNRFKRVVRDLSKERGKMVHLEIHGEKTELDKRMIDELGDPLVHLVRNSIDHGMESPEERTKLGKPELGTIVLEARHSGNNVFIYVRDDGGGIDAGKIKDKLIEKGLRSQAEVAELSDEQVLEYIWHPGFSTAQKVTDVSGRGVGMDVVRNRILSLNGTVEVNSTPRQGTTFALRLPLTLAIIDCLLVRLRNVVFSIPIDDVREIVSLQGRQIVSVHSKQTFDLRGQYIPLVNIDDVFHWHHIDYRSHHPQAAELAENGGGAINVVVLQVGGRTMGLHVDELIGSQDIVIKSLSDNFINIRGLSGASILGDGSVCLMLDVGSLLDTMTRSPRAASVQEQNE